MPLCEECNTNEAKPDFPYCQSCNDEKIPTKQALTENGGHTLEYIQHQLKIMSDNAKLNPPQQVIKVLSPTEQYMRLSFDQLKAKEKEASEWLLTHTGDPLYSEAKVKYTILVKVLNRKSGAF